MSVTFRNTKTSIPGWVDNLHEDLTRSYAYRKGDYLVSLYGSDNGLFIISSGLTVTQNTVADISQWALDVFGAVDILEMKTHIGKAVQGVWRPGMLSFEHINKALDVTDSERWAADQVLGLLISKLYDLFLYVEPTHSGLSAYGHKTRELLMLAATEVENMLRKYAQESGIVASAGRYTMADYVRLCKPLYLSEYEITLKPYSSLPPIAPFGNWSSSAPTKSLVWYDAYNKTNHDREAHFGEASLERCVEAVSACIVLFAVRYSPHSLYEGRSTTASLFSQVFEMRLSNPDPSSFYIPDIDTSKRYPDLVCGEGVITQWESVPLTV